jgi:predicted nucleotidyltransferase
MIILNEQQLKIVHDILQKHVPEEKIMVFGSRITGTIKPYSDLDLCIMGTQPLSLQQLGDLREDFSESDLPFRVDIVEWTTITPEFKKIIEAHCEELPPPKISIRN